MYFQKLYLLLVFLCFPSLGQAQSDWNWPKDKKTAQGYHALYTDALRIKDYKGAAASLDWLLENVPQLHRSLYQHGEIIYAKLAAEEENTAKRRELEKETIHILNLREKYFGDSAAVANRKGILLYTFYKTKLQKSEQSSIEELDTLQRVLLRAIELNGIEVYVPNLLTVLDVMRRRKHTGIHLPRDSVIHTYGRVTELLNLKRAAENNPQKLKTLENFAQKADKLLANTVEISCELINNILGPQAIQTIQEKLQAEEKIDATYLHQLKIILRMLKTYNCSNTAMELQAYELMYKVEPSSSIARTLAKKHQKENNKTTALRYYQEALDKSQDDKEQAQIYLNMARIEAQKGNKASSRTYAYKSLQKNPSETDPYDLIGSLYIKSYEECKQGVSRVDDRAVFIAAYNMFKRAGNNAMMAKAEAQFPTTEQIFELGLTEGTELTIGCWIQKKVLLLKAK